MAPEVNWAGTRTVGGRERPCLSPWLLGDRSDRCQRRHGTKRHLGSRLSEDVLSLNRQFLFLVT